MQSTTLAAILATVLLPIAAAAQEPMINGGQRIEVDLSNFKFNPDQIVLHHGQRYVLHLVNRAGGGHDFNAKSFFAAAAIAPEDRALVTDGEVELHGNATVDIHLVAPAAGSYELHCGHFMHTALGMKGKIQID